MVKKSELVGPVSRTSSPCRGRTRRSSTVRGSRSGCSPAPPRTPARSLTCRHLTLPTTPHTQAAPSPAPHPPPRAADPSPAAPARSTPDRESAPTTAARPRSADPPARSPRTLSAGSCRRPRMTRFRLRREGARRILRWLMGAGVTVRGGGSAAAVASALAFVAVWLTTRHGIVLGPDAWTYWSSSVSLLEGKGYVDAHGLPVASWPIGYPLWLAAVQSVFGVSAMSVQIADAIAIAGVAGLACCWGLRRAGSTASRLLVVVAAAGGATASARGCSSEFVMLLFCFGALLAAEGIGRLTSWAFVSRAALVSLMAVGGIMTRHAALAFLPGLWFLFVEHSERRLRATVAWAVVSACACGVWWWARAALGQQGSHPWLSGQQQCVDIVAAMVKGVDRRLGVYPLGVVWFVLLSLSAVSARARRLAGRWLQVRVEALEQLAPIGFVWVSLAALLVMFLLVYVADPAGRRFVSFAGLIAAVLTAGLVGQARSRTRYWVLALVLLPPMVPVVRDVVLGRVGENSVTVAGGESFVPLDAVPGPPGTARTRDADGRIRVPVPLFVWQRRALERRAEEPR